MIEIILLCLGTASLSSFLDMCMEAGMILNWYYKLIERLPEYLFKPLGGCIYCFSTWVYILVFAFSQELPPTKQNILGLFLGLGINYIFIKAFEKYVVQ